MTTDHLVPADIRATFHVREWRNAAGVLATACPNEWTDIIEVLRAFRLLRSEILTAGGGLSPISQQVNDAFKKRGWTEKNSPRRSRSTMPNFQVPRTRWTASRAEWRSNSNGTTKIRFSIGI